MSDALNTGAGTPASTPRRHKDGKAAKIRALIKANPRKPLSEIAADVGTTPGYVYGVRRRMKNKPKTRKMKTILVATSNVSVKEPQPQPQPFPSLWSRIRDLFKGANRA